MKHVLLVEDDPDVRALLTEILDEAGFGVTDVRTFADARHLVDGEGIDLVVTDVVLPDGRGTELAQYAERRGLRTLVLTGNVDRMQELALRDREYLAKPFRSRDLLERVHACLGGSGDDADGGRAATPR
jgi:two-component system OmpR family response regulator